MSTHLDRARAVDAACRQRAARLLREAGVPPEILSATDLLAFEPDQWPPLVRQARRLVRMAELAGPAASTVFREAYGRGSELEVLLP
jgi:hypothetical protein